METPLSSEGKASLYNLLSTSLILRNTTPFLSACTLLSLSSTSKAFRALIIDTPDVFRYLDLSTAKSAIIPYEGPLDSGGINWRAERMDEAFTEDEYYSGPLMGIFSTLQRQQILPNVQTLVLDGLSVPADLVRVIITEERFNVKILSIREVQHLNERKLMQTLGFVVRPSRPRGTPKLKGLYIFGPKDTSQDSMFEAMSKYPRPPNVGGVTTSEGAQIGAEWNQRSSEALEDAIANLHITDKWYQSRGRLINKRPSSEWATIMQACEGIIYFDAVLCRGPRHDIHKSRIQNHFENPQSNAYLPPAVATVALGPAGCASCNDAPEGFAVFGQAPSHSFPLLSPPPLRASTIRAAQTPMDFNTRNPPALLARCDDCLRGRWCERCNKWWDEFVMLLTLHCMTSVSLTSLINSAMEDRSRLLGHSYSNKSMSKH
jgi:hypothetical protein